MPERIFSLWRKLKAPPGDNRGAQRWRRIFVSIGVSLFSRVFGFACNLLIIPIALGFLGVTHYGLWVTLTSSVALLTVFDFGVGIGLQNRVAEMLGKNQLHFAAQCLRSTLAVLSVIVSLLFAILVFIIFKTPTVDTIFRGAHFSEIDADGILIIIVGAFVLGLPLGLFSRMAFGLQKGWIASIAGPCGTGLSLLAVFMAARMGVGFKAFVAVTVIPPIAAQIFCYFLLSRQIPGGIPLWGTFSWSEGLETVRQGIHYVLPLVVGTIITQGPLVFLGTLSSPINAATYSILARISMPFEQMQIIFLIQVWPAITEALHGGDTVWLKKTLRQIFKLNLLFGAASLLLVPLAVWFLFPLLTHNSALSPSKLVIGLYALYTGITSVTQGLAYIMNSLFRMRGQNYIAIIAMIFAFTALPFAARHYGVLGIVSAMLLLNGALSLPVLYREYRIYLKQA